MRWREGPGILFPTPLGGGPRHVQGGVLIIIDRIQSFNRRKGVMGCEQSNLMLNGGDDSRSYTGFDPARPLGEPVHSGPLREGCVGAPLPRRGEGESKCNSRRRQQRNERDGEKQDTPLGQRCVIMKRCWDLGWPTRRGLRHTVPGTQGTSVLVVSWPASGSAHCG
ncbi:hypothetical protein P154DRAFT_45455 [Amniculicola lignicola CBS 123094]|uniref:Uncharacterized protein n=1 Tax=Amniculicola lignicola CBS 123094 TaxID=1392246 RepID=A0A6A5WZL8_9PLEO|nr:hypothetical protein P154DRAFT_45455 [Amniculicola lignicola CBS 123094]